MEYEIIQGPFMLYETVGMLYKYVNRISFQSVLNKRGPLPSGMAEPLKRRADRLQQIMEEVCADLDPEDAVMQRYFGRVGTEYEYLCLAQLMTHSFCTLKYPDLQRSADEICGIWRELQARNAWIHPKGVCALVFSDGPESPGNLIKQIRALKYPVEFQLELCETLTNFDESMQEMVCRMAPYAARLEKIYSGERWLFDELEAYWQEEFRKIPPTKFLDAAVGEDQATGEKTVVAVSLMNSNLLTCETANDSLFCTEYNAMYIGSFVTSSSLMRKQGDNIESVAVIMKYLGDRKRLEILRRLSKDRFYGMELAEDMGMNPGNLSRSLAMLHNYGFIRQERGILRTYYQSDREAFHNFLELVERTIFE